MTVTDDIIVAVSIRPMTGRELATHLHVDTATINTITRSLVIQGRIKAEKETRGHRLVNIYSPGHRARETWYRGAWCEEVLP